jgi:methylmalonyl-CoA/ethylmalonyl-CoA epimerase
MLNKIDHIGIAVNSIDEYVKLFQDSFDIEFLGIAEVPSQKVKTATFRLDNVMIELLEPIGSDSPISGFLAKKGAGIHHIAFGSANVETDLVDLKEKSMRLIDEAPNIGDDNSYKNAFIHPKSTGGILFEIIERLNSTI